MRLALSSMDETTDISKNLTTSIFAFRVPPFTLHTAEHVLLYCPLHEDARARSFGSNTNLPHIFGTEAGGRQPCDFIHATQVLRVLRPLPPRPDPP